MWRGDEAIEGGLDFEDADMELASGSPMSLHFFSRKVTSFRGKTNAPYFLSYPKGGIKGLPTESR